MIVSETSAVAPAPPPDEARRRRITSDLDATLFVEAGAGAGTTSSLVARIVNLVRSGVPTTGTRRPVTLTWHAVCTCGGDIRT